MYALHQSTHTQCHSQHTFCFVCVCGRQRKRRAAFSSDTFTILFLFYIQALKLEQHCKTTNQLTRMFKMFDRDMSSTIDRYVPVACDVQMVKMLDQLVKLFDRDMPATLLLYIHVEAFDQTF
jgi:hypothetical protein